MPPEEKRMNGKTKLRKSTETKLKGIAKLSDENRKMKYQCLMPHFNKESLIGCFHELDGKKAVGIDQRTKESYGKNLEGNIEELIERMKKMSYRPAPVREVLIPKEDGKRRPLGISTVEDKVVQLMMSKILEAIYEPIFHEFSYGFRRGRGCHDATKDCQNYLDKQWSETIIDIDLENFFGTISHKKLVALLEVKIKDKKFM